MAHSLGFLLGGAALCFAAACSGGGSSGSAEPAPTAPSAPVSAPFNVSAAPTPLVVGDQFGYLPGATKILLARNPQTGFDADALPEIANAYDIHSGSLGQVVLTVTPTAWNANQTDSKSGDKVAALDISALTTPAHYMVTLSGERDVLAEFDIKQNIYAPIFKAAFKSFYYQRSGFEKQMPYASAEFVSPASHMRPGQDAEATRFLQKLDANTARDLHGGWYDAGDLNKYTNWTADYCLMLLASYAENPAAWGDNLDIPESQNGMPDVLDEVRWGMDWLLRMQSDDGSVLSILGSESVTPPSDATAPSYYGDASTSATLSAAAAFAYGAHIYRLEGDDTYAEQLRGAAEAAWQWAEANPDVTFRNNDLASQTKGLGAGQQEVDERGREIKRLTAAARLFEITGDAAYGTVVEDMLPQSPLINEDRLSPYLLPYIDALIGYARHPDAAPLVRDTINSHLKAKRGTTDEILSDAYRSPVQSLHWGSNATKASRALTLLVDNVSADTKTAAAGYVHYLHGANPLGMVYLSEMDALGAQKSVQNLYHAGFETGAPPGFVTGGPNPTYSWAQCCPNSCGVGNSCDGAQPSPPAGQPGLKAYLDFNENWTLAPWEVNENSNAYQVAYLRLLAFYISE